MLDIIDPAQFPYINNLYNGIITVFNNVYRALLKHPSGYFLLPYINRYNLRSSVFIEIIDPRCETGIDIREGFGIHIWHEEYSQEYIQNMEKRELDILFHMSEEWINDHPFTK